jgi:uncharacterized membrane protein YkoI
MGTIRRSFVAIVLGTTIVSMGTIGAQPQMEDESGPEENEEAVAAGTLDDGQDLLPLAGIPPEEAIAAAQGAASGAVGEVDLEYVDAKLAFNVDIGAQDVKVDAATGTVLAVDADD